MFDHDVLRLVEQKFAELFGGHHPEHNVMATLSEVKSSLSELHVKVQSLVEKVQAPTADTSSADNDAVIDELKTIGGLIDEAVGKLDPKPADAVGVLG